jgi:hypothetical protein
MLLPAAPFLISPPPQAKTGDGEIRNVAAGKSKRQDQGQKRGGKPRGNPSPGSPRDSPEVSPRTPHHLTPSGPARRPRCAGHNQRAHRQDTTPARNTSQHKPKPQHRQDGWQHTRKNQHAQTETTAQPGRLTHARKTRTQRSPEGTGTQTAHQENQPPAGHGPDGPSGGIPRGTIPHSPSVPPRSPPGPPTLPPPGPPKAPLRGAQPLKLKAGNHAKTEQHPAQARNHGTAGQTEGGRHTPGQVADEDCAYPGR